MTTGTDYPLSLPGAHGRIDAYRMALARAGRALAAATAYVDTVESSLSPSATSPMVAELYAEIQGVRALILAELAVTNP